MNAVPAADDLGGEHAAARPLHGNEAELSRSSRTTRSRTFNGVLDLFLGIVDAVRSYQPTQPHRPTAASGDPCADATAAGLAVAVHRHARPGRARDVHLPARVPACRRPRRALGPVAHGWFEVAPAARAAVWAAFTSRPTDLRAAGYPFENRGDRIKSIDVTTRPANSRSASRSTLTSSPTTARHHRRNTLHYEYGAQEDGQGAMRFECQRRRPDPGPMRSTR